MGCRQENGSNPPPDRDATEDDAIDGVFLSLHDLPSEVRSERLRKLIADRPEVGAAVAALFAALDAPLEVLEQAERGPDPGALLSLLPRKIGEFHVLELLGRGGMGAVYRAEQEQPSRHVALKVLLPADLGGDSLRRFAQEAEVLARLQHPGIAQVFGAGSFVSALGSQPFFAMELIEGHDLLAHCRRSELDVPDRCKLLARVCDAVQHAHDRGIVHRDLKPGNVLVLRIDETVDQPKVLDFGIARCLDPDARVATLTTQSGLLIGTLAYMSPEQFLFGHADKPGDVYALGVILYELVAGRLPFEFADRSMTEIGRLLADVEPPPMSAKGGVPDDLQTVVTRALAKEPEERYASPAELAADLRRFLANEPIRARPLTLSYQLRKFTRRNRAFVLGVAATMLALVAGTVVSLIFLFDARAQRELAQRREYVAELGAAVTMADTDPQSARDALARVADRAGLEWQLLQTRIDCADYASPVPMPDVGRDPAAVVCCKDGRALHFFSSEDGGSAILRDARSGIEIWRCPLDVAITLPSTYISKSGRVAAIGGKAGEACLIYVLDVATGSIVQQFEASFGRLQIVVTANDRYVAWSEGYAGGDIRGGTAHALDLQSGKKIDLGPRFGHLSPSASGDAVWMSNMYRVSAATGEKLPSPKLGKPDSGPTTRTYENEDASLFAVRRSDHRNVVVYDQHGKEQNILNGPRSVVADIAMHGHLLAGSSGHEGVLRVWDLRTSEVVGCWRAEVPSVLQFSNDGKRLLVETWKGAAWFDVTDRRRRLIGHSDYILAGALGPTGRLLATGDTSGELRLWDLDRAVCIGATQLGSQIDNLWFHADGRKLTCLIPGERVVDLASLHLSGATSRNLDRRAIGRWTAPVAQNGSYVKGRSIRKPKASVYGTEITIQSGEASRTIAFEPVTEFDGLSTAEILRRHDLGHSVIRPPLRVLGPVDHLLGVGASDGSFAIVELASGRVITHQLAHLGPVTAIAILPELRRVVTGGVDATVRFWDMDSWTQMCAFHAHERAIEGLVAAPDGSRIVSWSADRTIHVWETRTSGQQAAAERAEDAERTAAARWVDDLWRELEHADEVARRIAAEVDPASPRWLYVLTRQYERLRDSR